MGTFLGCNLQLYEQLFNTPHYQHHCRFGRKWAMLAFAINHVVANVVGSFMPYFWLFVLFRVMSGISTIGTFVSNFTYGKEVREFLQ